jgi:hypothetical protein
MDEQLKPDALQQFKKVAARKYRYFCKRTGQKETLEGLVDYLMNTDVIKHRTIAHYMTMEWYPEALYHEGHFCRAYEKLADDTGLSQSTIRNYLKRPKRYAYKSA